MRLKEEQEEKNIMEKLVIAGFAGIGKTTLSKLNPKDVIDMEIRPYKYANYKLEYTLKQWYSMEHILNENFLPRYIEDVKNEIENGTHKIIFVWLTKEVLKYLYVINEYAEEKGLETIVLNKNENIEMRLENIL